MKATLTTSAIDALSDIAALQVLEDQLRALTNYAQAQKDYVRHVQYQLGDPEPFMRKRDDLRRECPPTISW